MIWFWLSFLSNSLSSASFFGPVAGWVRVFCSAVWLWTSCCASSESSRFGGKQRRGTGGREECEKRQTKGREGPMRAAYAQCNGYLDIEILASLSNDSPQFFLNFYFRILKMFIWNKNLFRPILKLVPSQIGLRERLSKFLKLNASSCFWTIVSRFFF